MKKAVKVKTKTKVPAKGTGHLTFKVTGENISVDGAMNMQPKQVLHLCDAMAHQIQRLTAECMKQMAADILHRSCKKD